MQSHSFCFCHDIVSLTILVLQETFRALIEDDDMDLVLEEENNMYALIQETYGVIEVNTNRQLVRTNRGEGWRRVQRFMFESKVQCLIFSACTNQHLGVYVRGFQSSIS